MNRRSTPSPFSNRVLIGTVTTLVLAVAVFLAYNANSGLPFVPTYNVNAQVPDAAGLLVGDGVLIGGARIGYVSDISATQIAGGRTIAVLHLKLARSIQHFPVDSTDLVRPVSPLGLKYLEITRGQSLETIPDGGTIPLSHTSLPVELNDFFSMFDAKTRRASQIGLDEGGDGFAGRGGDLNQALSQINPLVTNALPALTNIMDPRTRWSRFFPSLEQAAHETAGVADQQAALFTALDETFTPLSQATVALQAAIRGGPPSLQTGAREFPAQAQFTNDTATLFERFRPAFVSLGQASAQLVPAEAVGIPALRRTPELNNRLNQTFQSIQSFAEDPATMPGLKLLTDTANLLQPTLAYVKPAQTQCNYLALFFRNIENSLSESDSVGSMLRVLAMTGPNLPQLTNSESGPSSGPANGPPKSAIKGLTAITGSLADDSFLHSNPYPYTAAPGQPSACQAGNEVYVAGRKAIGSRVPLIQRGTEVTRRMLR